MTFITVGWAELAKPINRDARKLDRCASFLGASYDKSIYWYRWLRK